MSSRDKRYDIQKGIRPPLKPAFFPYTQTNFGDQMPFLQK